MKLLWHFAFLALLTPVAAAAQCSGASQSEIVVTAQRSGAPMWTIETASNTVILVGDIHAIPKATPWYPDRLEQATAKADRVILTDRPNISASDFFRLLFKGGSVMRLPKGTTAADYLASDQLARLTALEARYRRDYARSSFFMTALDLLSDRLGFDDDITDATALAEQAANDADVPTIIVERFAGKNYIDSLFAMPAESHVPCLEAAMTATEAGPATVTARADAWRRFDIPGVMSNPLEVALGTCWPWADPQIGAHTRTVWVDAITRALDKDGVTVAVVPLRVLAEAGGVLDQLEARGFDIGGPAWKLPDTQPQPLAPGSDDLWER